MKRKVTLITTFEKHFSIKWKPNSSRLYYFPRRACVLLSLTCQNGYCLLFYEQTFKIISQVDAKMNEAVDYQIGSFLNSYITKEKETQIELNEIFNSMWNINSHMWGYCSY